ncbi:TPA: hypothetical protein RNS99_004361 [Stenotrophomonas maltophilia]|uniref:hypothetical protein n=1 Tax=Stenotrophomonas maltophilia TaxID=40324 RepID=UPI0011310C60|nr:hypothetical protein [Stenotrophomonas maltophilia]MBH1416679.1 hypothetical protein [Stenotrophomonas maltophilia]HDX0898330.1 hypothetical protein [Stenotrophomonas maltophilia]HDX0917012.1 hypothetical protein [Stenotrophomonas maltophilia]HDX0920028.1 hypothetical protein [Stenotrophomonas maltophilia]HEL3799306.1 hypothetical protein [Stenotrophomonas maltophilia]
MGAYTLFYGKELNAGMSVDEMKAAREESCAAFKAAINEFSVHDNPSSTIRKRRIHYLMMFSTDVYPEGLGVMHGIRHSDRSGIVPAFRDFMVENRSRFFQNLTW